MMNDFFLWAPYRPAWLLKKIKLLGFWNRPIMRGCGCGGKTFFFWRKSFFCWIFFANLIFGKIFCGENLFFGKNFLLGESFLQINFSLAKILFGYEKPLKTYALSTMVWGTPPESTTMLNHEALSSLNSYSCQVCGDMFWVERVFKTINLGAHTCTTQ